MTSTSIWLALLAAALVAAAPLMIALYHAPALRQFLGRIAGCGLVVTPIHDQSSCSLLRYTRPGDHIGWHVDHNFYNGRHFTVLIVLRNERDDDAQRPASA